MAKKKTASKKSAANGAKKKPSTSTVSSRVGSGSSKKAGKSPPKKGTRKKSTRRTDAWSALSPDDLEQYFRETPAPEILTAFEESYTSDVVNVLLDLRKAVVRQLFESLVSVRKRAVAEAVTLYHYKDYLMNPLPLEVGNERTPNYYAILGVPRLADAEDIKTAHRMLVKAYHTDNFSPPMRPAGLERLAEINDAFRHLHTEEKREQTNACLPNIHYLYPRRDQSWLEVALRILE